MWTLYLIQANSNQRKKYDEFESVIEAFRTGNQLMKKRACYRYRVERKEGEMNEA